MASLFVAVLPAWAWDGAPTGKITSIDVTAGTNYAFRVYLNGGGSALCTNGTSFAYLNEADSNYKVYVAALLMAKAQGSTVTLFVMTEGGMCHIGYIGVGQ
jgi:tartrate dehydratase alpha subunit/fumarate hydratase class I-like protein